MNKDRFELNKTRKKHLWYCILQGWSFPKAQEDVSSKNYATVTKPLRQLTRQKETGTGKMDNNLISSN